MSELKFKIGDEVLVKGYVNDIAKDCTFVGEPKPYWIMFNGGGVWVPEDIVYSSHNKTLDDWKLAGEISRMLLSEIEYIFGDYKDYVDVFMMSPNDVRKKLDAYRNSKPKMGDVVKCMLRDGVDVIRGSIHDTIFFSEDEEDYWVLDPCKSTPQRLAKSEWTVEKVEDCKVDIAGALEGLSRRIEY